MHWSKRYFFTSTFLLLVLLIASCGSEGSSGRTVSTLEDVKGATVRVVAQGTFIDPQVGMIVIAAGSGTGFIIDQSGIVVTNNHVVTGAALLQIYVGGEDEPRNAKILGVSECSDLAVIDIEGEGYPALGWYEKEISTGMDVYAAGYPLGDPEYTLTKGIVSKEQTSGETPWSSVDHVIEHDATINPGNSGGPLVTADGEVVAVNYLKSAQGQFVAAQYFAIARDQAVPVIEELRAGIDVHSIGVNGEAVNNGEGLSGIWVASVKSGSAADVTGVKPGDIILSLEGLVLATDYTMADYCDILRTHDADDVLSIEVLRFSTGEILKGQLNGRPLETLLSFLSEAETEPSTPASDTSQTTVASPTPAPTLEGYPSYRLVRDDYGALEVKIPISWSDIDGRAWAWNNQNVGVSIWAAPDLESFESGWTTPGMKLNVTTDTDAIGGCRNVFKKYEPTFLDACLNSESKDLEQRGMLFQSKTYSDCGGRGTIVILQCAVPTDGSQDYLVWLQVTLVNEPDIEALINIRETFNIVGDIPFD